MISLLILKIRGSIFYCTEWHFFGEGGIFFWRGWHFFVQVAIFFAHYCNNRILKSDELSIYTPRIGIHYILFIDNLSMLSKNVFYATNFANLTEDNLKNRINSTQIITIWMLLDTLKLKF